MPERRPEMDERERSMLELVLECERVLKQCQNTLNEIWAEWTRTHGLRGGVSQPLPKPADEDSVTVRSMDGTVEKVVRRTLKR